MTGTEQYVHDVLIAAIPSLIVLLSNISIRKSQKKLSGNTNGKIDVLHEQMNGNQDKLIVAVTDAATQRGAQQERDKEKT
jgi:hypothetical protein